MYWIRVRSFNLKSGKRERDVKGEERKWNRLSRRQFAVEPDWATLGRQVGWEGEGISAVEKCENYWYCWGSHIIVWGYIDVAVSSPRARTFSPILTGSFYGGTTAEAISKREEGMFQRQSADGSDISQQYFSIIACYENLYRARPSIIELSSLFLSKFYSRSSLSSAIVNYKEDE